MKLSSMDKEVLSIMVTEAKRVCDHAAHQWWSGKYGSDEKQQREMISEWKEKKMAVISLALRIKSEDSTESSRKPEEDVDADTLAVGEELGKAFGSLMRWAKKHDQKSAARAKAMGIRRPELQP